MNLLKNITKKEPPKKKKISIVKYFSIILLIYFLLLQFAPSSLVKLLWASPIEYIHDSICYMQKPAHFKYSGVNFDYPKTLNKETENSAFQFFYAKFFRMNDSIDNKKNYYTDKISAKIYSNETIEEAIKEINPYTYSINSSKDMIIDGRNATSVLCNRKISYGAYEVTTQIEKIFIQNDNNVYLFELDARIDRFERDKKDFDKIIQSIKFK